MGIRYVKSMLLLRRYTDAKRAKAQRMVNAKTQRTQRRKGRKDAKTQRAQRGLGEELLEATREYYCTFVPFAIFCGYFYVFSAFSVAQVLPPPLTPPPAGEKHLTPPSSGGG
ncbi:MAG: hypothetical protein C0184_06230 [Chloroflexus aggregans]|uniref:Uncharacterized protein n=1 Tax=Chloroflexus aggregans TaxID=152260 RepID=A0A2J6X7A5_9CHLR|nr:MAG: hypothetical protein C0184_06230 [Chloroflexus aggregans]